MRPYVWTINGTVWVQHEPITERSGKRGVLSFHNMSMMARPIHLHGQLPELQGSALFDWLHPNLDVPAGYADLK